jgi:hypothetical protein
MKRPEIARPPLRRFVEPARHHYLDDPWLPASEFEARRCRSDVRSPMPDIRSPMQDACDAARRTNKH